MIEIGGNSMSEELKELLEDKNELPKKDKNYARKYRLVRDIVRIF